MTLKVLIMNDAEEVMAQQLTCIAGVPAPKKILDNLDSLIVRKPIQAGLAPLPQPAANTPALGSSLDTQAQGILSGLADAEDLVHHHQALVAYQFNNITLRKNDRMYLPVFDTEVPVKEGFVCELPSTPATQPQPVSVWHTLHLSNHTTTPWTSGSLLVTRGGQFLAHSHMRSTLVGKDTRVDVAPVAGVSVTARDTPDPNNSNTLITTVTLSSKRTDTVTLHVKRDKLLGSVPTRASGTSKGDPGMAVTLQPGETATIDTTYHINSNEEQLS